MNGPILRPEISPASSLQPIAPQRPAKPVRVEGLSGGRVAPQGVAPLGLSRSHFPYSSITLSPESFPTLETAGSSLLLLLWLLMRADPAGAVCAGTPVPLKAIAEGVHSSRSSVKVGLGKLRKAGLLETTTTRHGLILRVRMYPFFTRPENGPILIVEPDKKPTGQGSVQPSTGQDSSRPQTTGQPSGQKSSPPLNRASLLLDLYKEFCRTQGIQPRLSRFERQSVLLFLQQHPKLRSEELKRAFENFCRIAEPESVTLSKFVQESEQELAGLSEAPTDDNQKGVSP